MLGDASRRARARRRHRPDGRGQRRPPAVAGDESVVAVDRVARAAVVDATTRPPARCASAPAVTYAELLGRAARRRWCRRWPRPPARSARRRSATPARSAATSARARRPATGCRCSPRSTPPSSCVGTDGVRTLPVDEFMVGVKRTARRPGELIVAVDGAGARRLAGLRQGRRAQRDGDRRRQRPASSSTGRPRSVRARPRVGRPDDRARARGRGVRSPARVDWDDGARRPTRRSHAFGALGRRGRPADRRPPVDGGVPPPRGRGAGRAASLRRGRSRR